MASFAGALLVNLTSVVIPYLGAKEAANGGFVMMDIWYLHRGLLSEGEYESLWSPKIKEIDRYSRYIVDVCICMYILYIHIQANGHVSSCSSISGYLVDFHSRPCFGNLKWISYGISRVLPINRTILAI